MGEVSFNRQTETTFLGEKNESIKKSKFLTSVFENCSFSANSQTWNCRAAASAKAAATI